MPVTDNHTVILFQMTRAQAKARELSQELTQTKGELDASRGLSLELTLLTFELQVARETDKKNLQQETKALYELQVAWKNKKKSLEQATKALQ